MKKGFLLLATLLLFAAALFTGCKANENENKNENKGEQPDLTRAVAGRLFLTAGSWEVVISYADDGEVRYLTSSTADAAKVVEACQKYVGWDCVEAVFAVMTEMKAQGAFDGTLWGNEKVVVLRMVAETEAEDTSDETQSDLIYRALSEALTGAIEELGLSSRTMLIGPENHAEPNPDYAGREKEFMSAAAAWSIAMFQGKFEDYKVGPLGLLPVYGAQENGYLTEDYEWVTEITYPELEVYEIMFLEPGADGLYDSGVYVCRVDGQNGMVLEIGYKESKESEDYEIISPDENLLEHFEERMRRAEE